MISKSAVSHRSSVISLTELISHRCKQFFKLFSLKKVAAASVMCPTLSTVKTDAKNSLIFSVISLSSFSNLFIPWSSQDPTGFSVFAIFREILIVDLYIFSSLLHKFSFCKHNYCFAKPFTSLGQILHFLKEVYWFLMTSLTWDVNYASILWDLVVPYLIWGIHSIASVGVVLNSFLASSSAVFIFLLIICIIFIKLLVFKPNFTVLG